MQSLTYTTIRKLPEVKVNSTDIMQLQLACDYWQGLYAEAGSMKERAWCDYNNAVDMELPRAAISDLLGNAQLFDDICADTWREWENAKRNLLAAYN